MSAAWEKTNCLTAISFTIYYYWLGFEDCYGGGMNSIHQGELLCVLFQLKLYGVVTLPLS